MAEARHVAHEKSEWRALTSEKDWCQVGDDVIGFESFAKLGQRHTFSPNVKAGSPNSPAAKAGSGLAFCLGSIYILMIGVQFIEMRDVQTFAD